MGEGSYSIVFQAQDNQENRPVAVKRLKEKGLTKEEAEEARQIFFKEINILKTLEHPAIPEYYDFLFLEGGYYLVMQWVEGKTLLDILEDRGHLTQSETLEYMERVADALAYMQAREEQVIYRDLKPSNIIVDSYGRVKIIDFGTARIYSPAKNQDTDRLGTPGYAPPEAYGQLQTNQSSDVYSFGATFYHLLTGQEPMQFNFRFPDPRKFNPAMSEDLSLLLRECLRSREKRIPNARFLLNRLNIITGRDKPGESKVDMLSLLFPGENSRGEPDYRFIKIVGIISLISGLFYLALTQSFLHGFISFMNVFSFFSVIGIFIYLFVSMKNQTYRRSELTAHAICFFAGLIYWISRFLFNMDFM